MSVSIEDLDLNAIQKELGNICLTEARCGKCAGKDCLIGYSQICTALCRREKQTYVPNGFDQIPPSDIRGGYDEYDVLHAIAHILMQCRSCKSDHFENCIINIIRSCYEVIEFGSEQEYEGDVVTYMMKLHNLNPEKASIIATEYSRRKELQASRKQ